MALPAFKTDCKYTYGDYCSWPEDERWEIIDGIPMAMCPAPNRFHQGIIYNLISQISPQISKDSKCKVYPAPFDVRLPESDEADESITTVVQPDISIICDNSRLDDKGCKGAPDLIMEILSPSTASRDLRIKKDLYEKHGVKEYWIVHPGDKIVIVYRQTNHNTDKDNNHNSSIIYNPFIFDKGSVYTEKDTVSLSTPESVVIELIEVFRE